MKIDVIICAYNAHKYIKKALDSIINQTIIDKIDITIVDDGSNYSYEDIIKNYDKEINLIKLKKNRGIGLARKEALNKTNNEYIMFIDSDDEFYNNQAIEKLYNVISNNNDLDIVEGNIISNKKIIENSLTYLHGKMYRRKFIMKNNINFLDLKIAEDIAFNLSLYASGANVKKIDDIIYNYNNNNEDSITHIITKRIDILKSVVIGIDYVYKKTKDYEFFTKTMTSIYEHLIIGFIEKRNLKSEDDLITYARICKKFYKKYKKYILDTDYINMHKNIFDVF